MNGEPGVLSARFMGATTPYPDRFAEIFRRIDGRDRAARFVTALAVARGNEILFETETTIEGEIAHDASRRARLWLRPDLLVSAVPRHDRAAARSREGGHFASCTRLPRSAPLAATETVTNLFRSGTKAVSRPRLFCEKPARIAGPAVGIPFSIFQFCPPGRIFEGIEAGHEITELAARTRRDGDRRVCYCRCKNASLRRAPPGSSLARSVFTAPATAPANDEFIELFNTSSTARSISGWMVRASNNNTPPVLATRLTLNNVVLQPGCFYLVVNSLGYNGSVPGDQSYTTGFGDNGGVALTDASGVIIDQVGLGTAAAAYGEGTRLAPLTTDADRGYERNSSTTQGFADTNNNGADFHLQAPSTPQNSQQHLHHGRRDAAAGDPGAA